MYKIFALMGLLFCTSNSFASGKLFLQPSVYPGLHTLSLSGGLMVYEPWIFGSALDAYVGLGETPTPDLDVNWLTARVGVAIKSGPLTITPGIGTSYLYPIDQLRTNLHVRLTMDLW